jgi:hypothetical protein
VTRSRRLIAIAVALASPASVGAAPPAPGSAPRDASVADTARVAVTAALERLEAAEAALRRVNEAQAVLEAEILDLKSSGGSRGRLEDRLRASVAAEGRLQQRLQDVDAARSALRSTANAEVRRIDRDLRRRAEDLHTGPEAARRQAAAEIRALLSTRQWLMSARRRAEPPEVVLEDLAALKLPQPDPLDGPEDLREKADYAEDARDKLRAKRTQLARLLDRQRRTKAIARAARDFAVDVSLFDEEVRTAGGRSSDGRSRDGASESGGNGGRLSSGAGDPGVSPGAPQPGRDDVGSDGAGANGNFNDLPGLNPPPNLEQGGGEAPTIPEIPQGSEGAGDASRGADPVVLLSLRVDQLADEGLDAEALEALLAEYARLEALFSARARAMRAQARRLDGSPPEE